VNGKNGGINPVTSALRTALAARGVLAPHTGQPFSEAMLLGLGGGLGAGYILWEFKSHESATLVLGFRYRWNYVPEFMARLCERIGVSATIQETSGVKGAAANLHAAPLPAIAWADKAHLSYQHLPESLKGHISHVLTVHALDADSVTVSDLGDVRYSIERDAFAAARARISSDKNRLMLLARPAASPLPLDLKAAIRTALQACANHLGGDSESFGLPAWKKWAKLLTHSKDKKGWPTVFKERQGLFSALRSTFEGVALDGTEGYALRHLYAAFLDEADQVIGTGTLAAASAAFRAAGEAWAAFAESALPDSAPALKETKSLLRERYRLYRQGDLGALGRVSADLEQQRVQYDRALPLADPAVMPLLEAMSASLSAVHAAEVAAVGALRAALAR
jgi:hypothetical protein